jgi:hypothetical protein
MLYLIAENNKYVFDGSLKLLALPKSFHEPSLEALDWSFYTEHTYNKLIMTQSSPPIFTVQSGCCQISLTLTMKSHSLDLYIFLS